MRTLIGYVRGPQGERGLQGEQGVQGEAATIEVGTVTTVPYGQTANVTNSGTSSAAVFDFQIPRGQPGEQVTDMQNLTLGAITTSSASFPIPAIGETGKVLWGKVVKWFSDMAALVATKFDAANVVNNLTTTASGYALDARQGKTLNDKFKTTDMFEKLSVTVTTSATGNANLTQLNADKIVVGVHSPVGMAVAFVGRGMNGAYYVHMTDSSGTAIANTSVSLDVYYV